MIEPTNNESDFSTALTYSASAPLAWSVVEVLHTESVDTENEQCLRTILNLSEHHSVDVTEEIAALERKVDVTLEMVATLLRASIDMPTLKEFRLGAHEISWQQNSSLPTLGANLKICIYLHEVYPKPLTLFGQVTSVGSQECVVDLASQSDDVQQLLEKFIFLHHRRAIAQAKQS